MKNLRDLFENIDINADAVITLLVEESDSIRSAGLLAQEVELSDHLTMESFLREVKTVITQFEDKGSHPVIRIELPSAEVLRD